MEQQPNLSQLFISKQYLADKGVADILLYPEKLSKFLIDQDLLKYFNNTEGTEIAVFLDANNTDEKYDSAILEYSGSSSIQRGSVQVMLDSLLREENLCPVRIMVNDGRYEMLLAPLSERNIAVLDKFYDIYRVDVARAYRVRKYILNKPFSSKDLPNCLATLFIKQNTLYEEIESRVHGIMVSDDSFNPDATIMAESPEQLAQLFSIVDKQKLDNE